MWGDHITDDDEPRCFGGYTTNLDHAERYAVGDFERHCPGAPEGVFRPDPAPLNINFMKDNWKWDTVLVDAELMQHYCIAAELPMKREEAL